MAEVFVSNTKFAYLPQIGSGLLLVEGPYIVAIAGHFIIDMVSKGIEQHIDTQGKVQKNGLRREIRFSKNNADFVIEIDLEEHPQIICSAIGIGNSLKPHNLGGYNLPDFTGPASAILSKLGVRHRQAL